MKDGGIAQSGTHEELLEVGGEYAKLYKIQADAFSSGGDPYVSHSNLLKWSAELTYTANIESHE